MTQFSALIAPALADYEQRAARKRDQLQVGIAGAFRRGKSALMAALPVIEGITLVELPGYGGLDAPPIEAHSELQEGIPVCDLIVFVFQAGLLPMHADEVFLKWLTEAALPVLFVQTDQGDLEEWGAWVEPNALHNLQTLAQALAGLDRATLREAELRPLRQEIEALFRDAEEHLELIGNPQVLSNRVEILSKQFMEWFRVIMARRVNRSQPHELAARDAVQVIHTLLNEAASNILNEFQVYVESVITDPDWLPMLPAIPRPPGMIAVRVQSKGSEVAAFVAQAMRLAERHQPAIHQMLSDYAEQVTVQLQQEIGIERERLHELRDRWHSLLTEP